MFPGILQGLATVAEFRRTGWGIIVGLLTPVAALGLICNMLVAICMVHLPAGHPFVGGHGEPSFEPAAGYLAVALLLLLTGPGASDRWTRCGVIGDLPTPHYGRMSQEEIDGRTSTAKRLNSIAQVAVERTLGSEATARFRTPKGCYKSCTPSGCVDKRCSNHWDPSGELRTMELNA